MTKFLIKTHSVQFENVQRPFWTCFYYYIKGYNLFSGFHHFFQKNAQCLVCTKKLFSKYICQEIAHLFLI
jgi:hypothetical protein